MSSSDIINDGLVSFTSKMGTSRDKAATAQYVMNALNPNELMNAYRTSWLARAVVDKRQDDATRKWREWHTQTPEQISALEKEERRLKLKQKVNRALKLASLMGGSAIYFDTGQSTTDELNVNRVGRNGVRFATVLSVNDLTVEEVERDPLNERFGLPSYYTLKTNSGTQTRVHWSHLAIFTGGDTLDSNQRWGDSDLMPVIDAMKQFEGTCANVASLVYEAKIDVFGIAGLANAVSTTEGENGLKQRYALLATMKGVNGMIVMDKDNESYDQKSATFAGLTDVMDKFQQNVSGAAGYPRAILFGTASGGLGSTGELELSSYYDRTGDIQENDITPAVELLDECLIRSALGSRPEDVFYNWRSLWQVSDKDKADIGKVQADTITALVGSGLFDPDSLRDAAVNMFAESGTIPGLENIAPDDDETGAL